MSVNHIFDKNVGYAYGYVYLPSLSASTFHTMIVDTKTIVAESGFTIQESYIKSLRSTVMLDIDADWTDEEEEEWDALFAKPHVQEALNRLSEEAVQQFATGEFEEGGFAVE